MLPPVVMISSAPKSPDGSDRVNVNCACSPAFNDISLEVILMVGTTVSTFISNELEGFAFPAASVNLDESTLINPLAVLFSSGVNVAVSVSYTHLTLPTSDLV